MQPKRSAKDSNDCRTRNGCLSAAGLDHVSRVLCQPEMTHLQREEVATILEQEADMLRKLD
jgi:hypothetical protein